MSATTTIGLETWLTTSDQTPTVEVPTAITKAKPAAVTLAATVAVDGDLVFVDGTGFSELDRKWWIVGAATGTGYELVGSDTTGSTATLGSTPSASVYAKAEMVKLCLATVDPAVNAAGTTSVATYCDPSATVPAVTQPGTLTMTGFVELGAAYDELYKATEDGIERVLRVILPNGLGSIVVPTTLSSIGWQLPVDGAIGFTVTGAMGTKPRHLY